MEQLEIIVLVVGIVAGLYAFYRLVRHFAPAWGTLLTNGLVALAGLAELLGALPWNMVLNKDYQGAVMMGIAIVNGFMRMTKSKQEVPTIGGMALPMISDHGTPELKTDADA